MRDRDQPLSGHLTELRRRALVCVVPFLILLIPGFLYADRLLGAVFRLCTAQGCEIYLMGVTDALSLRLRAAGLMALLCLLPLLIAETLLFAFPGLYPRERQAVLILGVLLGVCFSAGAWLFLSRLAEWLLRLWLSEGHRLPALLSAARFYEMWLWGLVLSGLIACLPAAALLLGMALRRRKTKWGNVS